MAQGYPDPIKELAGEWDVKGATTSIIILPNHIVQHSRFGRGDIKWDNADYYNISFRDRSMECHYILRKGDTANQIEMLPALKTEPSECDLGELRRVPQSEPPPKHPASNDGSSPPKVLDPNPKLPAPVAETVHPGSIIRDCDQCPEMTVLGGGAFTMGSPVSEAGRDPDEGPVHNVTIAQFAIGRFPVTRKQFAAFVTETAYKYANSCHIEVSGKVQDRTGLSFLNPSIAQDDSHPAVCVSWYDALAYVSWLSTKTGKHYRLPSEAEREYATRAGTSTPYFFGETITTAEANFELRLGDGEHHSAWERNDPCRKLCAQRVRSLSNAR